MGSFLVDRLKHILLEQKGDLYKAASWISVSSKDPVEFSNTLDRLLSRACKEGCMPVVRYLVDCDMFDPQRNKWALIWCGLRCRLAPFEYMVNHCKEKSIGILFNEVLDYSAKGGDPDIVRCILREATNLPHVDGAVYRATQHNNLEVVKVLLEFMGNDSFEQLNRLFRCACTYGYKEIAEYLVELNQGIIPSQVGNVFHESAKSGQLKIVKWLQPFLPALYVDDYHDIVRRSVNVTVFLSQGLKMCDGSVGLFTTDPFRWRIHILLSFFKGNVSVVRPTPSYDPVTHTKIKKRYLIPKSKRKEMILDCGSLDYYDGNLGMIVCSYLD